MRHLAVVSLVSMTDIAIGSGQELSTSGYSQNKGSLRISDITASYKASKNLALELPDF
jgi:hypothetical protein